MLLFLPLVLVVENGASGGQSALTSAKPSAASCALFSVCRRVMVVVMMISE